MKLLLFLSFFSILPIFAQQPPLPSASLAPTSTIPVAEKAETIWKALQELRDVQIEQASLAYSQANAMVNQKSIDAEDAKIGTFSCIIDRENDGDIVENLVLIQHYLGELISSEEELKKFENQLTQNPHDLMRREEEHASLLRAALLNSNLLFAVLQLNFHNAIRKEQKTARTRGCIPKMYHRDV